MTDELKQAIEEYLAVAREPWPYRQMKRDEIRERFIAHLKRLRPLRDRVVALKKREQLAP